MVNLKIETTSHPIYYNLDAKNRLVIRKDFVDNYLIGKKNPYLLKQKYDIDFNGKIQEIRGLELIPEFNLEFDPEQYPLIFEEVSISDLNRLSLSYNNKKWLGINKQLNSQTIKKIELGELITNKGNLILLSEPDLELLISSELLRFKNNIL